MPENIHYTPVEEREGVFFKRVDLFMFHKVSGGKVRSSLKLSAEATKGLTTAGSRKSPQIQIISEIAKERGLPFLAFAPAGKLTPELEFAKNNGADIRQVQYGYNNNIIKHAREAARELDYTYIPFGMEDARVLDKIAEQTENLPENFNRLVISIGSGMTLCGIIKGFEERDIQKKIIGVRVGANPLKRLDKYAPNWRSFVTIVESPLDYHKEYKNPVLCGIEMDPIYEAKCIDFVEKGDLVWIVGKGIRC